MKLTHFIFDRIFIAGLIVTVVLPEFEEWRNVVRDRASESQRTGDSGGCEGKFSRWFILYCLLESVSHPSTAAASSCDKNQKSENSPGNCANV